jgi:hypothetical protein
MAKAKRTPEPKGGHERLIAASVQLEHLAGLLEHMGRVVAGQIDECNDTLREAAGVNWHEVQAVL